MDGSAEDAPPEATTSPENPTHESFVQDTGKLVSVKEQILSDLEAVDVDLLQSDPFRLQADKRAAAWRSTDAVARATSYLDLATAELERAEHTSHEYVSAVSQAHDAANATTHAESETQLIVPDYDAAATAARLDKLALERSQLEKEKDTDPADKHADGIDHVLRLIEAKETSLKQQDLLVEVTSGQRELLRQYNSVDEALSEMTHQVWNIVVSSFRKAERKRKRRSAWRYRFYTGRLLAYAFLVVVIGVIVDAVLGHTNVAGLWTSLATAIMLWAIDRWLVSRRIERWNRRKELKTLKYEIALCVLTLVEIRILQASIDMVARSVGASTMELLSAELMQSPAPPLAQDQRVIVPKDRG
jgi:hypothetical protein